MARRTFADFDAELKLKLANRSDITATMRAFFINDGYYVISGMMDDAALQGYVSNQANAADSDRFTPTPADFWWPIKIKLSGNAGQFLRGDDIENVDSYATGKPAGPPFRYYWFGGQVVLDTKSVSGDTFQMWYKKKPVELVAGNSAVFDSVLDPLIPMFASIIGLGTVRDYDEAGKQAQFALKWIEVNNLPVNKAKLANWMQGFQVRTY